MEKVEGENRVAEECAGRKYYDNALFCLIKSAITGEELWDWLYSDKELWESSGSEDDGQAGR